MAMMEVCTCSEPRECAPAIAAHVRGRKPSEISKKVQCALFDGWLVQVEFEEGQNGALADLVATGLTVDEAQNAFQHSSLTTKWKYIAERAGGVV